MENWIIWFQKISLITKKMLLLNHSLKITFFLHPFLRLMSSYQDKVLQHNYNNWRPEILKRHSRWRTNTVWYTFSELASLDPLWNTPPHGTLRMAYQKNFSCTVGGWHSWFSKICKKQQNWPFVGLLPMTLKVWYKNLSQTPKPNVNM